MAATILSHFSQLNFQDIVTGVSVVFGLVTLFAYIEQRRSNRQTATIAKWAERNLDKSISESVIRDLIDQKASMEEEVARKIPALARSAVLQEQVQLHERAIAEHVASWQLVMRDLNSERELSGVDPKLLQAIIDRIVPRYMRQESRDRLRTRVAVLSVILAASAAMLPYPINSILGFLLVIPLIYTAVRLYALNEDPSKAYDVMRPWFVGLYLLGTVILGAAGVIELYIWSNFASESFGAVLLMLAIFLLAIYVLRRTWIDHCIEALCGTRVLSRLLTRGG